MIRHICQLVLGIMLLAFSSLALVAQTGVDTSFNAIPSNPLATDTNFQQVVQPDGKVIVYGAPPMFVNGEPRSGIFRLNADGSTDTSFTYNDEGGVGINNVTIAPDGKILLAGTTSPNHAKMVRLNPDGSLDNSFSVFFASAGSPGLTGASYWVNAIQSDGKVIATLLHWGNIMGTHTSYSMRRYNLDASIDSSFTAPTLNGGHLVSTGAIIEFLPDGRFYLAISSGSHLGWSMSLTRRLASGAVDSTFTEFTRSLSGGFSISFSDLVATPDGGVLASGFYWPSDIGSPGQRNLLKFLPNGATDPGFASPNVYSGGAVHLLPDGKVLYAASGGSATRPLMRLNANGTVDNSFVLDPSITAIKNTWRPDPQNRPIFLAQTSAGPRLVRLSENGSIDQTFNPALGTPGTSSLVAVQPDGKVLVAGAFTSMNGTPRLRFARVNANGELDTTFDPGTGFSTVPRQLLVQPDGKILAVGTFTSYDGSPVTSIARLTAGGSIDPTFNVVIANAAVVDAVALQSDGKILIGGSFTSVHGINRPGLARLEPSGALDTTFSPVFTNTSIKTIIVEPSGKITIGGTFSEDGTGRANLARLESTGAFDPGFVISVPAVSGLWRQPDGKYLFATNAGGSAALYRRNIDGTADQAFYPPSFAFVGGSFIRSVVPMPDGTLIVGGRFGTVGGVSRSHLTRLAPNGLHDSGFLPTGPDFEVFSLAAYSADKVMVSGSFTSIEGVARSGIARLNVAAIQRHTPFDFDGDGRADISVVRPSTNRWYEVLSETGAVVEETFGVAGDILAPADFDGDGTTDEAIFRPSNGHWWYRSSASGGLILNPFGGPGDIPRPSDFDGDGKADLVIFRPSTNTWFRFSSLTNQEVAPKLFGQAGDQPLIGDFDGDGKSDLAIFRPSNGDWWYAASSANGAFRNVHWGQNGDIPVPADYDGDGRTDYAVYRPTDGGWYIYNSGNGSYTTTAFGTNGDRPVAADYDGDGRADIAVFRPSTGIWYLLRSTSGFAGYQFGISTDVALPGSLIP